MDKPEVVTSHDCIDALRRITGIRKIGHAGTLDPFATGLLIIGVGAGTKLLGRLTGLDKRYEAILHLGATSTTDDRTGVIAQTTTHEPRIVRADIEEVLKKFIGEIEQIPPMYSAKKVGGKKLYELARKGINIERAPVRVRVHELHILSYKWPLLMLSVHCSKGTYIRALARDVGIALGTGAYVEELRRTAIGPFAISEAVPLRDLAGAQWKARLLPSEEILKRI
jgi:tRNA pseudouridine55 synthase